MTYLALNAISVEFGGVRALAEVSIRLDGGEVRGLIGANGAGKSTCINVFSGFQQVSSGEVLLGGSPIQRASPDAVRRMGISRTFQAGRLFPMLTVRDNVAAAATGVGHRRAAAYREADGILEWVGLEHLAGLPAYALAYTDQRRTAIARALVGRPQFLLLDEPAAGMSAAECEGLASLIGRINDDFGVSILLVEHNVSLVLSLCRSIVVLDRGTVIAEGTPEEIRTSPSVREAYLGTAEAGSLIGAAA